MFPLSFFLLSRRRWNFMGRKNAGRRGEIKHNTPSNIPWQLFLYPGELLSPRRAAWWTIFFNHSLLLSAAINVQSFCKAISRIERNFIVRFDLQVFEEKITDIIYRIVGLVLFATERYLREFIHSRGHWIIKEM